MVPKVRPKKFIKGANLDTTSYHQPIQTTTTMKTIAQLRWVTLKTEIKYACYNMFVNQNLNVYVVATD